MSQNELTSDTEWMRIPTEAFEHKEVRMHIISHIALKVDLNFLIESD